MRLAALTLLLLAPPARADDPPRPVVPVASIVVPTTPPLVFLGDKAVSKAPMSWKVRPEGTKFRVEGTALLILDPVPGTTYRVMQVASGDTPAVDVDSVDLTVPLPPPTTDPAPPAPKPAPAAPAGYAGELQVVLIYDLNGVQFSTTGVRISAIKGDLKALNAEWIPLASSNEWAAPFLARMKADGHAVPTVFITDKAGHVLDKLPAPRSEAEVIARVKAIRGGAR